MRQNLVIVKAGEAAPKSPGFSALVGDLHNEQMVDDPGQRCFVLRWEVHAERKADERCFDHREIEVDLNAPTFIAVDMCELAEPRVHMGIASSITGP